MAQSGGMHDYGASQIHDANKDKQYASSVIDGQLLRALHRKSLNYPPAGLFIPSCFVWETFEGRTFTRGS